MCKRVECPNDGKPTWWGCGGHIEIALMDVPEGERCTCEHVPGEIPGTYEVPKRDEGAPIQINKMVNDKLHEAHEKLHEADEKYHEKH